MKSLLFLALLCASATAWADEPAPQSTTPPDGVAMPDPAAPVPEEKVQCRMERVLGSTRSKRVCTTAAQREASREAARRSMDRGSRCMNAICAGG